MIPDKQLLQKFYALSTDKQSEVIDFIEFLESKSAKQQESIAPSSEKKRAFGCMNGLVAYMSDDFDEPLEDFAEYM